MVLLKEIFNRGLNLLAVQGHKGDRAYRSHKNIDNVNNHRLELEPRTRARAGQGRSQPRPPVRSQPPALVQRRRRTTESWSKPGHDEAQVQIYEDPVEPIVAMPAPHLDIDFDGDGPFMFRQNTRSRVCAETPAATDMGDPEDYFGQLQKMKPYARAQVDRTVEKYLDNLLERQPSIRLKAATGGLNLEALKQLVVSLRDELLQRLGPQHNLGAFSVLAVQFAAAAHELIGRATTEVSNGGTATSPAVHEWVGAVLVRLLAPEMGDVSPEKATVCMKEAVSLIKRLALVQDGSTHDPVSRILFSKIWYQLVQIMARASSPGRAQLAYEALSHVLASGPVTSDVMYKLIIMKNMAGFYERRLTLFRSMRIELFKLLVTRVLAERPPNSRYILREVACELKMSTTMEPAGPIKREILQCRELAEARSAKSEQPKTLGVVPKTGDGYSPPHRHRTRRLQNSAAHIYRKYRDMPTSFSYLSDNLRRRL